VSEVVECRALSRTYQAEAVPVHALRAVDLTVCAGEFVSLAGPSGSGKSTLLNLIGGLDRPSGGAVAVGGIELNRLSEGELADLRLHRIGFIFQAYNLIPVLSARENVEFVMQLQGVPARERRARALEMLEALGLGELADRRPGALSGGQQQRVAIARALVTHPLLLLADEPSANLDSVTTEELLELLRTLNRERGVTIVTATHDPLVMGYARRQILLRDGAIVLDTSVDASVRSAAGADGAGDARPG
jgi:putative ABC transport system ATP-binding protein